MLNRTGWSKSEVRKVKRKIWVSLLWEMAERSNAFSDPQLYVLCVCAKSLQLCLTFCDPMDCSSPGSSVHEILQAIILEWVAIFFSRWSSPPRDQTQASYHLLHWQVGSLPLAPPGKPMSSIEGCFWISECFFNVKEVWVRPQVLKWILHNSVVE